MLAKCPNRTTAGLSLLAEEIASLLDVMPCDQWVDRRGVNPMLAFIQRCKAGAN